MEAILRAEHITKRFPGVTALADVNFRLVPGRVHALMGENGAGKSTLMKILTGIYQPDEGDIWLHGQKVVFPNPRQAQNHGIAMIHQELNPIQDMTIAENLFLGSEFLRHGFIDQKQMRREAVKLLERVGAELDPGMLMKQLTVSQMQMVEIAKALGADSEIIIMDEPSATITDREVANLFAIIERLKADGRCIVYITHKMDEVFQIADEITVLRDGQYIGTYGTDCITENELVTKMVDRELTEIFPKRSNRPGKVIFEVKNLSQNGVFKDISFQVRSGEIVGFSGLMGSGRTEVMNAVFGITKPDCGEIIIRDQTVTSPTPEKIKNLGIGYVTEDRKGNGLVLGMSVCDNVILPSLDKLTDKGGGINRRQCVQVTEEFREKLNIKTPDIQQQAGQLSGGNQQKIVLAKWLLQDPDILIFDEPTRGIDVGAKTEIYRMIATLAEQGKAILFISSEMPEILGMSDRIIVFYEGSIKGELTRAEATQEKIMIYASDLIKEEA